MLFRRAVRFAAAVLTVTGLFTLSAPAIAGDVERSLAPAAITAPIVPPAAPRFTTLAAAVAAQDGIAEEEHLRCLAGAVYFESQGEPLAGQLAVAQVILNRIKSGRFAADVCGVIKQRGQFGFVRGGAIPAVPQTRPAWRTAIAVAQVALAEAWNQTAPQALYFHGLREGSVGARRIATIGRHAFFR